MSKTNAFETAILECILNNVPLANLGDATGIESATDGSLHIALLSGDPGEAGDIANNEVTAAEWNTYGRVAVARNPSSKQWTVSSGSAQNANPIAFTTLGSGTGVTVTHFAVCKADTELTDDAIYYAALTTPLAVNGAVTNPTFAAGALTIAEG